MAYQSTYWTRDGSYSARAQDMVPDAYVVRAAPDRRCPECGGALSDEIEPNGHDGSPTRFCTDCGLGWPADEGEAPVEVSDTDNVVRAVHGLIGDIPVGDEQAG